MPNEALATSGSGLAATRAPHRNRFFVSFSAVLLLIVFAGFAPTLYLRAFVDTPPIPLHLHVHGAILTTWFILFFVQASLVSAGRSDIHRRLGIAGALFGMVVVVGSLMATVGLLFRLPAQAPNRAIYVGNMVGAAGLVLGTVVLLWGAYGAL